MNQNEMLDIALGAVRSQARRQGINPETLNADEAVKILDDLLRSDPTLIASMWYGEADDAAVNRFKAEWRKR